MATDTLLLATTILKKHMHMVVPSLVTLDQLQPQQPWLVVAVSGVEHLSCHQSKSPFYAFRVAAPTIWDNLPAFDKVADSVDVSKRRLKISSV